MAQLPAPDSPSLRLHRRQRLWQILLPVILSFVLLLAAGAFIVLLAVRGEGQARLWADISLTWLILPLMVFALILMVILGGLIYALVRLTGAIPRLTSRAQDLAGRASAGTRRVTEKVVKPFVWLKEVSAAVEAFFHLKGK